MAGAIVVLTAGCHSSKEANWSETGPSGSISDINRKLGGGAARTQGKTAGPGQPEIVLLVVHDAEGKPQYVEVQRSSGDPATDRRAQDYVLGQRRFPKGAANTVTVTVDPKRLPKR